MLDTLQPHESDCTADKGKAPVRVLLVDDDPECTEALGTLLGLMGYEVRVAHDGHEGLRIALEYQPHCAVLDLRLNGMDGIELARCLRSGPGGADMMLIATSGFRCEDVAEQAAGAFDHYLMKPIDPARLFELLER